MNEQLVAVILMKLVQLGIGIILCLIGKSLLEKGIRADFMGEGEVLSKKFRIITSSPGLVFLVSGLGIILATIFTQTEIKQGGPLGTTSIRFLNESENTEPNKGIKEELKPEARIVVSLVSIYADSIPEKQIDSTATQHTLAQLKNGKANQTDAEIIKMLNILINKDPKSLAQILKMPSYRWILQNDELVSYLHSEISRKIVE